MAKKKPKPPKRKVEDLTIDEILEVLKDKIKCGNCESCLADGAKWEDNSACSSITTKCFERLEGLCKKMREEPIKESKPAHSLTYTSTIKFMKSRGYKHCYMCGSDLGDGDA